MGYAHVLGRHMVLRGLNDAAEVSLLNEVLGTVTTRERQDLYARRKRHKEQVMLLHELGHTLGAMHVTDPRKILYPIYEHTQSSFGPQNAGLMRAAAEARMARGRRDEEAEWRAVLSYLEKHSWSGWNEDEKSRLVAELHGRVRAMDEGAGATLGQSVRPADRQRFSAAERLEAAGRAADAWEDLEPLIDFYPDEPEVQRFACRLAVAAQRDRSAIESRCARAVQVAPGDAEPHLHLSKAYFAAKDTARALVSARKALELLGKATADGRVERLYGDLAAHLRALGAVTWAEQAAAKSRSGGDVAVWARTTRARYGIGPRGAVPPDREGEYVAARARPPDQDLREQVPRGGEAGREPAAVVPQRGRHRGGPLRPGDPAPPLSDRAVSLRDGAAAAPGGVVGSLSDRRARQARQARQGGRRAPRACDRAGSGPRARLPAGGRDLWRAGAAGREEADC